MPVSCDDITDGSFISIHGRDQQNDLGLYERVCLSSYVADAEFKSRRQTWEKAKFRLRSLEGHSDIITCAVAVDNLVISGRYHNRKSKQLMTLTGCEIADVSVNASLSLLLFIAFHLLFLPI